MKKLIILSTAFLMAFAGFKSQAADIYLVGELTDDKELEGYGFNNSVNPNIYTLETYVPAGYFDFYFTIWSFIYLVPTSGTSETIVFDNGDFNCNLTMGGNPINFINPDWEGGDVAFTITLDPLTGNGELTISENAAPEIYDVYLIGVPNDNTQNNPEWGLRANEDNSNQYTGEFYIPAGEFKFYFSYWGMPLVPASGDSSTITFVDGKFEGQMTIGSVSYWECPDWEGGNVTLTIDIDTANGGGVLTITSGNDSNGIDSLVEFNASKAQSIYNLKGIKIPENTDISNLPKGLYIINGKKVIKR